MAKWRDFKAWMRYIHSMQTIPKSLKKEIAKHSKKSRRLRSVQKEMQYE